MKKKYIIVLVIIISTTAFFVFNRDTPAEKLAKHIKRGDALFEQGEFRKARLEYKNASKIAPADVEVEYRWGLVDEAEGDIRSAFTAFMQAEQQDPHFHKAKLKIAHYYLMGEELEEAQKRVDEVLADAPDNAEAHALNAALLLRKKDFPAAEKEARLALDKEPANITATAALTGIYLAQNDINKAGEALETGIKLNPKDTSLLMLKAKIYENPLNLEKINETYQEIFKLKPKDIQFRLYLANTYLNSKKVDEAEAIMREAVNAMPDDWNMKHELINFLAKNRELEVVEKEINAYMQKYPQNNELYLWLSDIYISKKDTDKAVALLEQIVSKENTDKYTLSAKTSLAHINFTKGNKDIAKKMADAVLKTSANNSQALFIRANIAADQGDYQAAVSDLRLIIHNQPQAKDAFMLLSEVFLKQGYNDLAIETLNQLVDIDPTNSQVLVHLAQLYNLNGKHEHATKILDSVNKNEPKYAAGWENTARVAISKKDFESAKSAIKNLDGLEGQHMTATLLEGHMASAGGNDSDAFSSYSKVIESDPSSPLAEHALFSLVNSHQKPDELEMVASYIASLETNSPYVSTILGECYMQLGKTDLATAAFDKAIANNSIHQDPYIYRAQIYLAEKKNDEAITTLKTASEKIPTDVRAAMMEAGILLSLERYKESVEIYDSILKNHPKIDEAANNMAAVISDHEYTDPAMLEKAQQAAEQFANSNNPAFLDTLGWVYYRQGKFDKALKMLAHAIELDKKASQEMHYHYGAILWKSGNIVKAKEELALAVKEGANYPELKNAEKILKELSILK